MRIPSYFVTFFILLLGASCSVKKEDGVVSGNFTKLPPVVTTLSVDQDIDQDGLSNELEERLERDSKTGNFPKFSIANLRHTKITLKDLGQDRSESVIKYSTLDNMNYGISYNPIRDKTAKAAYRKAIGKDEPVGAINAFDFGILKLSNFNEEQLEEIRNLIRRYDNDDALHTVTLKSIFTLKVEMIKGITKLYDVKGELGFIGDEGEFNSFGSTFDILSTDRTRIVFNSTGLNDSSTSNMEALIYLDRLEVSDLEDIFENNHDLALKIHNYKADTAENKTFEYSDQVRSALDVGTLFAVSNKDENYLFFNSNSEQIEETLRRLLGSVDTDGEGTLVGVGDNTTNTDFPIIFEEGGNEHLRQSSWHVFSVSGRLYDVPEKSETVMVGFFTNNELAKAGNRVISQVKNSVVSDVNIACDDDTDCINTLSSLNIISPAKSSVPLNNLSLGEVVKIYISGENIHPSPKNEVIKQVRVLHSWDDCQCPNGDNFCSDPYNGYCQPRSESYFCDYRWRDSELIRKNISKLSSLQLFESAALRSAKRSSNIPFTDDFFFNLHKPIYEASSASWLISFLVTEDFLSKYGEFTSLVFPEERDDSFRTGFLGMIDDKCIEQEAPYVRDVYTHLDQWTPNNQNDEWRPFEDNAAIILKNYEVKVIREFN